MVKSRQVECAVASLERLVDKLRKWGHPAAVVYSTKEGALKTYGTSAITDIIKDHSQDIFTSPDFLEAFVETDDPEPEQVILPQIDPPLSQRNFDSCRRLATNVVKAAFGGGRRCIGWGDPTKKPEWWPAGVPWTKKSLQSGVNHRQLIQIIEACYSHHGQPVDVSLHFLQLLL